MRTILALLAVALTPAVAVAQIPDDERVPQTDSAQEYPRFLRQIHVDGFWDISQSTTDPTKVIAAFTPAIAVDPNGVVYIVYAGWSKGQYDAFGAVPEIYVVHNRYKDRRANSWSPPLNVSQSPAVSSTEPDIAIGSNGAPWISWTEHTGTYTNVIMVNNVTYTDAAGAQAGTPAATLLNNHHDSSIAVDGTGIWHVAATLFGATNHIEYQRSGGVVERVTDATGGTKSEIDVDATNVPHVTLISGTIAKYSNRLGGAWIVPVAISNGPNKNASLSIDKNGFAHFAYDRFAAADLYNGTTIKYRYVTSYAPLTFSTPESVPLGVPGKPAGYCPKIKMDSRIQPRIFWVKTGGVSYAAKVNRYGGPVWGRQEGISSFTREPFAALDTAIGVDDNLYMTADQGDNATSPAGVGGLPPGSLGIVGGEGEPGDPHDPLEGTETLNSAARGAVFSTEEREFNLGGAADGTGSTATSDRTKADETTGNCCGVEHVCGTDM